MSTTRSASRSTKGLAVLAGMCGSLDSVLNIAFPDLTADLDLPVNQVGLIIVTYVAPYGLGLIPAGRFADRHGGRLTVAAGGIVAMFGLALASLASGLSMLLVARAVQGVGTAMVMAAAPALLTRDAADSAKGRALGLLQTSTGVGLTLGPLLGAPIVIAFGWRAVFSLRIPLFVALVALALITRRMGTSTPHPSAESTVALTSILRNRPFIKANTANLIANGAAFTVFIFGPTYIVDELGASELTGGIVLALWAAATATAAPLAGRLTDRHGPEPIARGGLGLLVAGLLIGAAAASLDSLPLLAVSSLATGGGLGIFTVANMTFVMGSLTREQQGVAGGITLTMRTAGILAAVGALTLVFNAAGGGDVAAESVGQGLTVCFFAAAAVAGAALIFGSSQT